MPRIRLTYWWDGNDPGDVLTVDEETATQLLGRVAVAEPEEESGAPARERGEASKA